MRGMLHVRSLLESMRTGVIKTFVHVHASKLPASCKTGTPVQERHSHTQEHPRAHLPYPLLLALCDLLLQHAGPSPALLISLQLSCLVLLQGFDALYLHHKVLCTRAHAAQSYSDFALCVCVGCMSVHAWAHVGALALYIYLPMHVNILRPARWSHLRPLQDQCSI